MTRYYELRLGKAEPTTVTVEDDGRIFDIAQETMRTRRFSGQPFTALQEFVSTVGGSLQEIPKPPEPVRPEGSGG